MGTEIQAVVFDVGRVIIEWEIRHLYSKLIDDPAELDWFCDNVVTEQWHYQHDAGRPLAEMVAELQADFPDHAHLIAEYGPRFLESIPGPVPGTATLIERLSEAEVPLFAITNFGAEFWEQFHPTAPVLAHFRDIVVSGQEKVMKPAAEIYRIAEARFGYPAEAMLFIDDNAANIAGARASGWQTHLFKDAPTLEADLIMRGLLHASA